MEFFNKKLPSILIVCFSILLSSGCSSDTDLSTSKDELKVSTQSIKEDSNLDTKQAEDEPSKEETITEDNQSITETAKLEDQTQEKPSPIGFESATVSRVVDGDTVVLSDGRRVRFIGVNTPESTNRHEEYGKEASNYTTSRLSEKRSGYKKMSRIRIGMIDI